MQDVGLMRSLGSVPADVLMSRFLIWMKVSIPLQWGHGEL